MADIMQDTWLKLANVGDATVVGNVDGFVRRVAHNAAIDHVRKERRRSAIDDEVQELLWETETDTTPERILIGRQALQAVEAALAALPEQTRRVFLMNRFDGRTHREIATRLGISETAVYYHIRRALEQLVAVRNVLPD
jgi:RNA polymerase sigma-70 factor (ECF subfamily)